jgi:LmbE family N-acetylglucosaminyl deacetylase
VISPHLDDGVLSCGDLLAVCPGSMLVTVFAGSPLGRALTSWDEASGFSEGDDVMGCRRQEDAAACVLLGATPCWLPYLDAQYGQPATCPEIAAAIGTELDHHDVWTAIVPMGLFHDDHKLASNAALDAAAARAARLTVYVYAEWPYHQIDGLVDARLLELHRRGFTLTPVDPIRERCQARKRRAVSCYRSQREAFSRRGLVDLGQSLRDELYWMVRW